MRLSQSLRWFAMMVGILNIGQGIMNFEVINPLQCRRLTKSNPTTHRGAKGLNNKPTAVPWAKRGWIAANG